MTARNSNREVIDEVYRLIPLLRKKTDPLHNWEHFRILVEENLNIICQELDTRWLISVCDTYVDYADGITRRNAMLVVQIANFEKLWATNLLMFDLEINTEKLKLLKNNKVIPLWDGMYSFNINHGDMVNNFFARMKGLMAETPMIEKIYHTVLERLKENDTTLANLDKYHQRLFSPVARKSLIVIIRNKIRRFLRDYRI